MWDSLRVKRNTAMTAQTFTVFSRRDGEISFESALTDEQVVTALNAQSSSFARDLARKFENLSPKQYAWAHKLAVDYTKSPAPVEVDNSQPGQFQALFDTFATGFGKGFKRMSLRFADFIVKPNRDNTAIWVTSANETEDGRFGPQPKYLGKITPHQADSRLADDAKDAIIGISKDPLTAAIMHGKLTGNCSCCGQELTDPNSIEAGIGPVCARKYGW